MCKRDKALITRSVFHLDCTPIIPQCGFKCSKCLQEIESVLDKIEGVKKFYTEGEGENMKLVAEHDSSEITAEELKETFGHLPSFYKGFFVPELLES